MQPLPYGHATAARPPAGDGRRPAALVLGGRFPSLAVTRNLAAHGIDVCVLDGGTSVARFSRSVSRFIRWPGGLPDERLPEILTEAAGRHRLQGSVLFPSSDEQVLAIARHRSLLAGHYVLTTPPWETVGPLCDKRAVGEIARAAGLAVPATHVPGTAERLAAVPLVFPVVLKPAVGSRFFRATGRKALRADDPAELQLRFEQMARVEGPSRVVIQELLPDPSRNLFSYAGFFLDGEPVAGLSVRRGRQLPIDFGRFSTLVETVDVPELGDLSARLLRSVGYTGLAEVEFMWDAERARFVLLEVNPRFWAWQGLATAAGLDLPFLAWAHATGRSLPARPTSRRLSWIRVAADVPAALQAIRAGLLDAGAYAASLRGPLAFAVFSPSDPLPALVEPWLLLGDRLRRRLPAPRPEPP